MKTLLYTLFVILCLHPFVLNAQENFNGTLDSWSNGKADIVSIKGEPVSIGEIDELGEFTISLNHKIINEFQDTMEATNSNSSSGNVSFMTIEQAFSCSADSLKVVNGNQKLITLETFGGYSIVNMEEKKMLGSFLAVNSAKYARSLISFGKKDAVTGYSLSWHYLEEPAEVIGNCEIKAYALNQKEFYNKIMSYQLNFKKGWNLVKISADAIYTDKENKSYVSKWSYKTISSIPEDAQYVYFPE